MQSRSTALLHKNGNYIEPNKDLYCEAELCCDLHKMKEACTHICSDIELKDGGTWRLKWERLKAGESNGKQPPRTCPGCSVPEPYRSHDWALVPAKPGLQG